MRGDERGDVGRRCGAREVSREPEWHSTLDFVLYDLRRDLGGNHTGGGTWIVVAYGDRDDADFLFCPPTLMPNGAQAGRRARTRVEARSTHRLWRQYCSPNERNVIGQ